MKLVELEHQILELHNQLNFRATLRRAAEIGELLLHAKRQVGHGHWQPWLHRLAIPGNTARVYIQVAKRQRDGGLPEGPVSLRAFLNMVKKARRAARVDEREEARQEAIRQAGPADGRFRVECSDCCRFVWPGCVDVIATDPPWRDLDAYRWLGEFAATHLRPGGIALVECGHAYLADVLPILTGAGLSYLWTLAMTYPMPMATYGLPLAHSWRMVLLLSRGRWDKQGLRAVSDLYTAPAGDQPLHEWQQPLVPWQRWLAGPTRPNELIADPYTGSATVACAAKLAGGRRFLGTDIDAETVQVARCRISETKEDEQ